MITHAFTCTGPYAVLILLGIKRVENRGVRAAAEKGRCAISCSKSFNKEEFGNFVKWASRELPLEDFEMIPSWNDVKDWPGKIVGVCDYSCRGRNDLTLSNDEAQTRMWDEHYPFWWDLSEIVCLDLPIACTGNVGMWRMPEGLSAKVTNAYQLASSVGTKVSTVDDAARIFRLALPIVNGSEGLFVLPLDDAHRTLSAPILVSLGITSVTTSVQPKDVFSEILKLGATSFIVAHNHPSGDVTPSIQDRHFTSEISCLCETLGIKLLDHLILTSDTFARIKLN